MKRKIIITLGPSTFNMGSLNDLKKQKINLYRINLSHTKIEDLPKLLTKLKKKRISPICIDTEGAQIRTSNIIKQYLKYLNALIEKGVHIVTVNDYLAKRDSIEMGQIYNFLGLSSGYINNDHDDIDRKKNYNCDITYATNSELRI